MWILLAAGNHAGSIAALLATAAVQHANDRSFNPRRDSSGKYQPLWNHANNN